MDIFDRSLSLEPAASSRRFMERRGEPVRDVRQGRGLRGERCQLRLDALDLRLRHRPEQRANRREEFVRRRQPVRRARRGGRWL